MTQTVQQLRIFFNSNTGLTAPGMVIKLKGRKNKG